MKNIENFLPETLYKPGFNKLSLKWELIWMDLGQSFTRFAEIIWSLTQADRNTFHYFQVWMTHQKALRHQELRGAEEAGLWRGQLQEGVVDGVQGNAELENATCGLKWLWEFWY